MKPSAVLRKAAQRIERGQSELACWAIEDVADSAREYEPVDIASEIFSEYFQPKQAFFSWFGSCSKAENQDRRVIALCLAAAIAESEGK